MKNADTWQPTKYVYKGGKLIASRDPKEVGFGSRLIADIVADFYDRSLPKHAKGALLDLGCGKVPLFAAYRNYVTNNICVDWEDTLHKSEHLDLTCDLTQDLPFKDEEFDTIILSDVLEHIPEPEHLWKEMARILAEGGKIILNVPFFYWLHEQPHDYYRYTEFALRRFVQTSGLRLVQLAPAGGVPEIMTDIFSKTVLRLPKIGRSLSIFAQSFASFFIRTGFGGKISTATSHTFPLGYFLIAEKPSSCCGGSYSHEAN